MAAKVQTHYDNLKVAQDAPLETITAAYRALRALYDPAEHPGNERVARIARIVDRAYEVLSNPSSRRAHDAWIRDQLVDATFSDEPTGSDARARSSAMRFVEARGFLLRHLRSAWPFVLIAGLAMVYLVSRPTSDPLAPSHDNALPVDTDPSVQSDPRGGVAYPAPAMPVRLDQQASSAIPLPITHVEIPRIAPPAKSDFSPPPPSHQQARPDAIVRALDGPPPHMAGYVRGGNPAWSRTGRSRVTIDNSGSDADVLVKLYASTHHKPSRFFYIPAGGTFTAVRLAPDEYVLKYLERSGAAFAAEPFDLTERRVSDGIKYTVEQVTLYKVPNGNMETHAIPPEAF